MSDLNQVNITGRLTHEPEHRVTPSGTDVADLQIAIGRKYKSREGATKEDTSFISCTAFGSSAKFVANHCYKGQLVFINGRLKQETWEDKSTGKNRSKIKITIEQINPLQWRNKDDQPQSQSVDVSRNTAPQGRAETVIDSDDVPF